MTLLVCHRDTGVVTLLADTRISGQIGALTDIGPKVMSVPVVVASGSAAEAPTVRTNFGFAFAGSTLAAMSTYALAATCLQTLITPEAPRPPAGREVAELFRRLGERYMREVQSTFEAFVIGPPDIEGGEPCAFNLSPQVIEGRIAMVCNELDPTRRGLWALGSGARPYMAWAQERRGKWRTIIETVDAFIQANIDPKVGGHVQAGRCDADGFRPHMNLSVGADGHTVTAAFLGVDEHELGLVDGLDIGADAIGPRSAFQPGAHGPRLLDGDEAAYLAYWNSPEALQSE